MSPSEQQQMTTTSSEEDAGENASDSKLWNGKALFPLLLVRMGCPFFRKMD
jgi:hypothetical protein